MKGNIENKTNSDSNSEKNSNLSTGHVCQGLKCVNIPEDAFFLTDEIHDAGVFFMRSTEEKFVSMYRMNVEKQGMI